ncbi:MAG: hypothetical protein WC378_00970 [Opitutaceae bacterium]|jgi:hypothetical protein
MADAELKEALELYLRRNFTNNIPGLRALAEKAWKETTEDSVTITSHGFDGGSASGAITCPRHMLLVAVERLLAEIDPAAPTQRTSMAVARFS